MNEARRFLRYVIPGLIFAIQIVVLLWLLRPGWIREVYSHELKKESGIALVFAALLASGGLGTIFSTIHHSWHRRKKCRFMDHREVINRLEAEDILGLKGQSSETDKTKTPLTRDQAWSILVALWHERVESNPLIKTANERTEELVDLLHSMGTNRVAAVAAAVVAFGLVLEDSTFDLIHFWAYFQDFKLLLHFLLAVAIGAGMVAVFQSAYVNIARLTQDVIDQVLSDALLAERKSNGNKVIILPPICKVSARVQATSR